MRGSTCPEVWACWLLAKLPVPERVDSKVLPIPAKSLPSSSRDKKRWVSNRNPRCFSTGRFQYRQCPTVQEYMIVDFQHQSVEVYRREKSPFWTYHAFGVGDDVELVKLGVRFSVAAVYEDVVFPPEED